MTFHFKESQERRKFIIDLGLGSAAFLLPRWSFAKTAKPTPTDQKLIKKKIPKTQELISTIGMGTWITFNVGESLQLRRDRTQVLKAFFENGGQLIDSSPMYGSSEEVLGFALSQLNHPKSLFSATKIWTSSDQEGKKQFQDSLNLWKVPRLDLEQVHNLVNWQDHLEFLKSLKTQNKIKFIGVTTSHGRRHSELKQILKSHELDFVQLTYNIDKTEADKELIPLAQNQGVAVIANRPFGGGSLIEKAKKHKLPAFAKDQNIQNWAEFLLKYITSHPGVTCAIPATSQVDHMKENMKACHGELVSEKTRTKMKSFFASL